MSLGSWCEQPTLLARIDQCPNLQNLGICYLKRHKRLRNVMNFDVLDYLGKPNVITRVLTRKRGNHANRGDMTREAEVGVICFEDGGGSQEPRKAGGWLPEARKDKEKDSLTSLQSECSPRQPIFFTSDLRKYARVRLCCFNPFGDVTCYSSR